MSADGPPHRRAALKVGRWAGRGFFQTLSRAGQLHPKADPGAHGVEVLRDLSYEPSGPRAESRTHRLDVYRPVVRREATLPIVLYIHGGAFQSLSKDTHWIMGLGFARRGYLVISINYRLAPKYKFPAAVRDVGRAFLWTLDNAARFGGDPGRVVVAGESAGANLAVAVTLMTCFERPEPWAREVFAAGVTPVACLPACGLLQVSDSARFARRRRMSWLVHDQIEGCERAYLRGASADEGGIDLADPLVVLESDAVPSRPLPPFFTFVGTRDPLLDDTRRLETALNRRGVDVEAKYYPGSPHAFHAVPALKNSRTAWGKQFAFLDRVLAGSAEDRETE